MNPEELTVEGMEEILMPDIRAIVEATEPLRSQLVGRNDIELGKMIRAWNRDANVQLWKAASQETKDQIDSTIDFEDLYKLVRMNPQDYLRRVIEMDNNALKVLDFLDWEVKRQQPQKEEKEAVA